MWFTGGNTDFLAQQMIYQGRFADIGNANNRDQATMQVIYFITRLAHVFITRLTHVLKFRS